MAEHSLTLFFIMFLITLQSPNQEEPSTNSTTPFYENGILVIQKPYFNHIIKAHKSIIVAFYAPWCRHSKNLHPEYIKAAQQLIDLETGVVLAKIDGTQEKELVEQFNIKGYPALKYFIDGELKYTFKGVRSQEEIVNWSLKIIGPISNEIESQEQLQKEIEEKKYLVVYIGDHNENFQSFYEFAGNNLANQYYFAHSFSKEYNLDQSIDNLVFFTRFDEKQFIYKGDFSQDSIQQFIKINQHPYFMPFDEQAVEVIFNQQNNAVILFIDDDHENLVPTFKKIAQEFRQSFKFSFIKPNDSLGYFNKLTDYAGVSLTNFPNLAILIFGDNNEKFVMNESLNEESIRQFILDYQKGQLKQYLKSQEIPLTNDGPVKVIVGKSFEDIVINSNQDVIIKFYAPWCGSSKKFAPVYEEIAKKLIVNPNIVVAEIDSTQNEVQQVKIESYPTLYFFANGNKQNPVKYEGERTQRALISFLKTQSTYNWVPTEENGIEEEKSNEVLQDIFAFLRNKGDL